MPHDMGARRGFAAGRLFMLFMLLLAVCHPAQAEGQLKGVALVIGQSAYQTLPALPNPKHDARAIEELLAGLGFETDLATDEGVTKLRRTMESFIDDAEGADVALVYYSGHGIEAGGINYLIPTDAGMKSLQAAEEELVSLQDVLERLRTRARVTILLLDACRSNPFPKDAEVKRNAQAASQPIADQGLGAPRGALVIDNAASADTIGEVIGFAAEPGRVALDGDVAGNSPYAAALLRHFSANDGFDFGQVMTMVTEEVYLATGTRQRPWTNTSLRRVLAFGGRTETTSSDEQLLDGERRKLLLTIAATPQEWRATIEALALEQSLPLDPLYGMLKELQVDTTSGPGKLEEQLREGAATLRRLMAERAPLRKDPELQRLADLADRAQAQGAIALAGQYRARASARADQLGKSLVEREADINADRIELATIYADEGGTAMLAFRFEEAAAKYQKAYEQLQGKDDRLGLKYKLNEGNAYLARGKHPLIRDAAAARKAAIAFRDAIELADRTGERDGWATAQYGYAFTLALPVGGPIDLVEADKAYEAALSIWAPTRNIREWSKAQYGRASVLERLGGSEIQEKGEAAKLLSEAAAAYQSLLLALAPDTQLLDWSTVQYRLGDTLMRLNTLEAKPAHLTRAVAAYRAALTRPTLDERAGIKSGIQVRLGRALTALGEAEENPVVLNEAVQAFEGAIATREKASMSSSNILDDVGWAKFLLGKRTQSTATIAEGKRLIEASWKDYGSTGSTDKDAYFQERLKQLDEALQSLAAGD